MRYHCIIGGLALAGTWLSAADAEPPRAARSVHLGWAAPEGTLFYLEMAVEQSTAGSYFMACGWNTGYFGIQELEGGRKVALTRARFTASGAEWESKENINAGIAGSSSFFLVTGGETRQELELRAVLNVLPAGLTLPAPVMP